MAEEFIVQYSVQSNPSYTTNLALFTDVTNSSELRQLIIQGKIEAALLNASMVLSFHLYIYWVSSHVTIHKLRLRLEEKVCLHLEEFQRKQRSISVHMNINTPVFKYVAI